MTKSWGWHGGFLHPCTLSCLCGCLLPFLRSPSSSNLQAEQAGARGYAGLGRKGVTGTYWVWNSWALSLASSVFSGPGCWLVTCWDGQCGLTRLWSGHGAVAQEEETTTGKRILIRGKVWRNNSQGNKRGTGTSGHGWLMGWYCFTRGDLGEEIINWEWMKVL